MSFESWLHRWLTHRPLKEPAQTRETFTAQVMARVQELARPEPADTRVPLLLRLLGGRLALAVVTAALIGFVALRVVPHPAAQVAAKPVSEAAPQRLAMLQGAAGPVVQPARPDLMRLAESPAQDDATWLEGTVELLDALDNDLGDDAATADPSSEEDWVNELDSLDQSELASNT